MSKTLLLTQEQAEILRAKVRETLSALNDARATLERIGFGKWASCGFTCYQSRSDSRVDAWYKADSAYRVALYDAEEARLLKTLSGDSFQWINS